MIQKKRKFSLDSSVQEGVSLTRGRRGSWKKGQPQQSMDEAPQHIQELNRSLPANTFRREESIAEESFERTDINSSIPKHKKSFHKLFPEIPDKGGVTHAFTCALQKDGLYQGKLFVSEKNVCFYSYVLRKETKVIIPVSSVTQVKKHQSVMSLLIQSADGEKYLFVSLMNRGMCYKLLQSVCSHTLPESNSSSPRASSGENEVDSDAISSTSSMEDSFDNGLSRKNGINNDFPEFSSEEWIRSVANRITSLFFISETRNVHVLYYAYILLMLLLLLTSGYIGLRIIALEEHLTSLDSVAPSSHHTQYKET